LQPTHKKPRAADPPPRWTIRKEKRMRIRQQALIVVPLIISILASAFGVLGYFIGIAFGMPSRLCMPPALRGVGIVILALGFLFMGWLFRYRKPAEILISTYVTMRKAIRQTRPDDASARTEPLILQGPQRHVRHPLYFAVVVLLLGWWLVLDYTFLFFMAFLFFLWFNLVVIRFEEKELKALYREEYETYAKSVPRFFPSLKCRWH
jgi:protein-S-isoprenylcysteine O-methyltransferase Ste14